MKICPTALRIVLASVTAAVGLASSQIALADPTNASASATSGGGTATAMIPGLPFGASEVVKMYQGGIGKDVIINYIDSAVLPFHLSADNIIYLQNLGVPQEITKTIIVRDGQLQQQAGLYAQQMAPNSPGQPPYGAPPTGAMPPGAQPPSQDGVLGPSTPPPAVGAAPGYDYGSAYYDAGYPYYYGPSVVVGGWWPGFYPGWGYRGWYGGYGYRGGVGGFRGGGGGFHGGEIRGGGGGGFGGHGGGGGHR